MRRNNNRQLAVAGLCIFLFIISLNAQSNAKQSSGSAETQAIREVEVEFRSGSIKLSGTLLIPPGEQPHPAIVLTHGSGPGPRSHQRMFADRFVRDGLVVLSFDKRGSGDSGGSWLDASLDDLAGDAISAAKFLRSRAEVDPTRVGVWGVSQAGWVIPRAIVIAPGTFQFATVVTGGAVRPIEVERYDYEAALRHMNVSPDQRRSAMSLVESYFEYLRTGTGLEALTTAIAAARSETWFPAVDITRVLPTESARLKWQWVATYEPTQDLEQLRIPILIVFGGKDRPSLSAIAQERWRTTLMKAGNSDATELVFVDAGHAITLGNSHYAGSPKYAAGYLELVDAWLKMHSGVN